MKKLLQENWTYTLYQDGERLILSVVCGSVALYELAIVLNEAETAEYATSGKDFMDRLASAVRDTPSAHRGRHLDGFSPE